MDAKQAYQELIDHYRQIALVDSCSGVLGWDQRVVLPPAGGAWRARQLAALAEIGHRMGTDQRIGRWLDLCEDAGWSEGESPRSATLRRLRRDHQRTTAVPERLVVALTEASANAYGAWIEARKQDDFEAFRPHLTRVLALTREKAARLGTHPDPYDTCLDQYEEGMTGQAFEAIMGPVVPRLRDLVQRRAVGEPGRLGPGPLPTAQQQAFGWATVQAIGFHGDCGRLDTTVHPFCAGLGPKDVRLTTRYNEHDVLDGLSSTLHEMGHGLYEQGLPEADFGLPLGETDSLGIHESQSRLWENHIGRSQAFGSWILPRLRAHFGEAIETIDPEEYHRRQCRVVPGSIRVEADEACYDLHIWLRFRLERALVQGELHPAELPAAWNAVFRELFGFHPPSNREGCLQDVHWSAAYGYFPTYSLGNCYAAQLMASMRNDLPDLDTEISAGNFAPVLTWLRERIHVHGRRYPPADICRLATGADLSAEALLAHIEARYG